MKHLIPLGEEFAWNCMRPDGARSQIFDLSDALQARIEAHKGELPDEAYPWLKTQAPRYNIFELIKCSDGYVIEATTH